MLVFHFKYFSTFYHLNFDGKKSKRKKGTVCPFSGKKLYPYTFVSLYQKYQIFLRKRYRARDSRNDTLPPELFLTPFGLLKFIKSPSLYLNIWGEIIGEII
jgi:hypothetical protein